MAIYRVQGPDGSVYRIEGPDNATSEQIENFAARQFTPVEKHQPVSPTDDMGAGERFLAGMGKGMVDLARGAGQRLGLVDQSAIDESRKRDAPLMQTGAGAAGNVAGNLAGLAPALLVPGANTVAGAAAVGGLSGALQPTAGDESALKNATVGAALGGASQWGLGKLANFAGNKLAAAEARGAHEAAQNAVKDATLKASQEAGYAIPPSQAGAGVVPRVLEGVSGKFKTNQAMALKNQNVTDRLARQALGLAEDAPLTRDTLRAAREQAFQMGYEPVANAGAIETDTLFHKALDGIVADYKGAARSFPNAVKDDVTAAIMPLKTSVMDTGDALKMSRILRDQANAAYVSGNNALGKATKQAANAIEDQIERALENAGQKGADLLKAFRDSRTLIAKTHSVEKALVESGGHVNARVLGAALQKGKPLSGELKTIGAFANNFRDVAAVPQSGYASPITALDAFGAAGMAGMGAGPAAVALPAARLGARSLVVNPAFQRAAVNPSYGPGLLEKLPPKLLKELEQMGAGGLLGLAYPEKK